MSFGTPSMPEAPNPAKRPERADTVEPEDIAVGGQDDDSTQKKGRRALRRPTGNTVGASSQGVGTGLNA